MCGIAAAFNSHHPASRVRRMLSMLRHRGDSSDPVETAGKHSALGTERLRIVDAVGGRQPVRSWDGKWLIAFNGEIYNHSSLRRLLQNRGIVFKSSCDSEVLVNVVAEFGVEALPMLDGMFAFVAIDSRGEHFIAARDPIGVKPLYLAEENGTLLFASEMLPLLNESASRIDYVPPGTLLTESSRCEYWNRRCHSRPSSLSIEENAAILKTLLEEAVRKRIPADRPCSVFFSGGVDSTLIFHIARKLDPNIKGFYIGNSDGEDWHYANLYAQSCGADVEFISFVEDEVLAMIPEVVRTVETFEPNQIRGGCLTYLLSRIVSEAGYKVALCGEGADELFCGYPELQFAGFTIGFEEGVKQRRGHFLDYLHRTQLQRVDRCSMRHRLEVREPFLDRAVIEFAESIPIDQLVRGSTERNANKLVLREVYKYYPEIPRSILERPKVVFTAGSGIGDNGPHGPFWAHARQMIQQMSDAETSDTQAIRINNHEERYYLQLLNDVFDVSRISFLSDRPQLNTT